MPKDQLNPRSSHRLDILVINKLVPVQNACDQLTNKLLQALLESNVQGPAVTGGSILTCQGAMRLMHEARMQGILWEKQRTCLSCGRLSRTSIMRMKQGSWLGGPHASAPHASATVVRKADACCSPTLCRCRAASVGLISMLV